MDADERGRSRPPRITRIAASQGRTGADTAAERTDEATEGEQPWHFPLWSAACDVPSEALQRPNYRTPPRIMITARMMPSALSNPRILKTSPAIALRRPPPSLLASLIPRTPATRPHGPNAKVRTTRGEVSVAARPSQRLMVALKFNFDSIEAPPRTCVSTLVQLCSAVSNRRSPTVTFWRLRVSTAWDFRSSMLVTSLPSYVTMRSPDWRGLLWNGKFPRTLTAGNFRFARRWKAGVFLASGSFKILLVT